MMRNRNMGAIEIRGTDDGFWVASYRLPGAEAYEIGRIRSSMILNNEERRESFKKLMTDAIGDIVTEVIGTPPRWEEKPGG